MKKSLLQNELGGALGESLKSVLPIFAIVLVISISLVPMNPGILVMFLFGTIMLIVGMSLFTIGSEISMQPIGDVHGEANRCNARHFFGTRKWPDRDRYVLEAYMDIRNTLEFETVKVALRWGKAHYK